MTTRMTISRSVTMLVASATAILMLVNCELAFAQKGTQGRAPRAGQGSSAKMKKSQPPANRSVGKPRSSTARPLIGTTYGGDGRKGSLSGRQNAGPVAPNPQRASITSGTSGAGPLGVTDKEIIDALNKGMQLRERGSRPQASFNFRAIKDELKSTPKTPDIERVADGQPSGSQIR